MLLTVVTASVVGSAFIVMDVIDGAASRGVDGIGDTAADLAAQVLVEEEDISCNTHYY